MAPPLLSTNSELKWALNDYESRTGTQSKHVEFLPGTGNQSYRIDFAEGSMVLRINGNTEHLGVDRQLEKQVLKAVAGTGITPQTRLWHEKYLVVDFVQNHDRAAAASVAKTLRKLHQLPVPKDLMNAPIWTPAQTVRDYLAQTNGIDALFFDHLAFLETYDWSSMTNAICHCDLNPNNILKPTTGGAALIDWEYARYGPIAYDIAVYAQAHDLDSAQLNEFLRHYPAAPNIAAITACRFAYKVIELLWLSINELPREPIEKGRVEKVRVEKVRAAAEQLSEERLTMINQKSIR
ncbi:MAG: thiamine kinase-like enzyme [Candidatus Azotimanducaceae bacterium]|jgi:thiamine kinase-like enzyme